MALFSDGARTPLMDDSMTAIMRRRMNELWGIGLLGLAACIGVALWSYNAADPSRLTSTSAPVMNWLGEGGAFLADELIRYTGLGAWFIVAFLAAWGVRLLTHIGEERVWARLIPAVPALLLAPVFASTHAVHDGWQLSDTGLGGSLGDTGARMLLDLIPLPDLSALRLSSLGLGAAMLVIGGAACGFTLDEASSIFRWLTGSLGRLWSVVGGAARRAGQRGLVGAREKIRETMAKPRSETMEPAEPTGAWRVKRAEAAQGEPRLSARTGWVPEGTDSQDAPMGDAPMRDLDPSDDGGPAHGDDTQGLAAKQPGIRLPKLPALPKIALPSLGFGRRQRHEPDISLDRLTGTDDRSEVTSVVAPNPPADRAPSDGEGGPSGALRAVFDRLSEEGEFRQPMAGDRHAPDPDIAEPGEPMPDDLHRAEAASGAEMPRTSVARDARRTRKSRKAEAERQPTLDLEPEEAAFDIPPLMLLQKPTNVVRGQTSNQALEDNARMLETVLEDYGVRGEIVAVRPGPVVTLYELEPAPGLKASRVIGLSDDIARSMSALSARVSTVPGRSIIGIELPNTTRETVWLRDVFETQDYGDARFPLALALGKDISGLPVVANLAKMPHLLIAGTTGSGKSVAINTMILSLLYRLSPQQCRLIMIDPKMLELSVYDNIPHLLAPVVTDPKKAIVALKWAVAEMEDRYRKMAKVGVRNIDGYNARVRAAVEAGEAFSRTVQTGFDEATGEPIYETETFEPQEIPYIVVIVDEMADLMMVAGKEIEACIQRLAQMARASGIHLIMATQRPSVDVITGTIKSNFPTRISFQVTSKIDSRTILGEQGAEQLLGQGDMLFMEGGGRIMRVHGPFVSDEEVEEVVRHLKTQGMPDYVNAVTDGVDDEESRAVDEKLGLATAGSSEDQLYDMAVAIVARDRKCSTSYIQRKLAIGYNKAARLVEQMEDEGVVTPANQVGKREIMIEER